MFNQDHLLIVKKNKPLPTSGIICAHPDRAKRIAEEFLEQMEVHTDYRGFQVYTGYFQKHLIFVGNSGIGAPAAAFMIEELVAMGVNKIFRLGSHDGVFEKFCLKVVTQTTLPRGLCIDYGCDELRELKIAQGLIDSIDSLANLEKMKLRFLRDTVKREIDFVVLKNKKPMFAVECKTGESALSPWIKYFKERTSIPEFYQVHLGKADFGIVELGRVLPFETFIKLILN